MGGRSRSVHWSESRWKERVDISELVGRPVRIEMQMREAELFAIRLDCQSHFANGDPIDALW